MESARTATHQSQRRNEVKRQIIHIDEEICDGCGECIPNCHEGALQIIDGKARLISDLFCDGLGACIGHCPLGAISLEEREAEPYDEKRVMREHIIPAGRSTIIAHLKHLNDHNEHDYIQEALAVLAEHQISILPEEFQEKKSTCSTVRVGGCPGVQSVDLSSPSQRSTNLESLHGKSAQPSATSELRQWPVQMHLISPAAGYFKNSDLLLAADCAGFSVGDFHQRFLKGKTLAIACPKLDVNREVYLKKMISLINEAKINTITTVMMEVPCCRGLLQMVQEATSKADRKVPVKVIVVSIRGEVLSEEWI